MNSSSCAICNQNGHTSNKCPELCAPLKGGFQPGGGGGGHSHDDDDDDEHCSVWRIDDDEHCSVWRIDDDEIHSQTYHFAELILSARSRNVNASSFPVNGSAGASPSDISDQ